MKGDERSHFIMSFLYIDLRGRAFLSDFIKRDRAKRCRGKKIISTVCNSVWFSVVDSTGQSAMA